MGICVRSKDAQKQLAQTSLIQCTKCRIQYIGETKRRLSDRFVEHRHAVEKAITQRDIDQPTAVSDHFTLPGHSLNNLIQIETLSERLERHF